MNGHFIIVKTHFKQNILHLFYYWQCLQFAHPPCYEISLYLANIQNNTFSVIRFVAKMHVQD